MLCRAKTDGFMVRADVGFVKTVRYGGEIIRVGGDKVIR